MTSIEWLHNELTTNWYDKNLSIHLLEQAKEMHKQEIMDAVSYGNQKELMASQKLFSEQYYKETFKKD